MKLKNFLAALVYVTATFVVIPLEARPRGERPPRYPEPRPERPVPRPERPVQPPDRPSNPQPPPYYPSPSYQEPVMVYVNRYFYNYDRLDLDHYINTNLYRGYRLNSIEVSLDSYTGGGEFSLVLSGSIDRTQYLHYGYQNFALYPSFYVQMGYNIWDISFLVRGSGQVYVRHLVLRLSR